MFIKKLTRQVICNLNEPVVSTPRRRLRGVQVDNGYIFRSIKYADAARFAMLVEPWESVKNAIMYGYAGLCSTPPKCAALPAFLPKRRRNPLSPCMPHRARKKSKR